MVLFLRSISGVFVKAHYAGSIAYDNDQGEWEDELVTEMNYDSLLNELKDLMSRKSHSEVFFAVFKDKHGKEHDITLKVKEEIG
jgi:hypothetical protein